MKCERNVALAQRSIPNALYYPHPDWAFLVPREGEGVEGEGNSKNHGVVCLYSLQLGDLVLLDFLLGHLLL